MIVLDASAILEMLLGTPAAAEIRARLFDREENAHAPHLLDLEVAQVLRRYCARGDLTTLRATEALHDLADLNVTGYPHDLFLPRIWELRHNMSAYDAAYIALAEALAAPLLTCDRAMASAPGHHARVELV